MITARIGVACLACALALSGCRVFDESLLGEADAGPGHDAGVDAPSGIDAGLDGGPRDAGPACPLNRPPPRPAIADTSGEQIVFALENVKVDQGDEWSTIGYDLDGLCSKLPEPEVECLPPAGSAAPELDGEGGTDNVFGHQIMPLIVTIMPDLQMQSLHDMHLGIGAIVIVVRGWNGEDDDPRVDAFVAQSVFGTPALDDGGMPTPVIPDGGLIYDEGGVPPLPEWDGRDWWWVRVETFLDSNPDQPMIRDDNAYVADSTLVMRLPDRVPIVLAGTTRAAYIKLTDAVLTLSISPDRQTVPRAVLAGRWRLADLLADIEYANVCRNTDFYRSFARVLDLTADVRGVRGTGGPGAVCDAISLGTTFSGVRAHLGGLSDLFRIPTPCADAGLPDAGVDGG